MLRLMKNTETNWYEGVDFEDSHLVTDKNFNNELGISGIIITPPKSFGSNGRVFGSAIIRFTNGLVVYGSLYVNKDNNGLNFSVDQRKDNNNNYFDINVRVPRSIQAQVIKHAMTKAQEVPVRQAAAPVQRRQAPVQQAPVQDAPPAPSDEDFSDYGLMNGSFDVTDVDLT